MPCKTARWDDSEIIDNEALGGWVYELDLDRDRVSEFLGAVENEQGDMVAKGRQLTIYVFS